jgi:hypothetical protein
MATDNYWVCRHGGVVYLVDKELRVYPYDQEKLVQIGVWTKEGRGRIVLFPGMEELLKTNTLDEIIEKTSLKKSEDV